MASTVQNRPSNPDGEYLPPLKMRCFDYILKSACDRMGIPYVHDRCAQLKVSHNGHPACHYCAGCTTGCETGSFFSPTMFFLPDAERTGKLELRANAHVRSVLVSPDGRRATGVSYIDRATRREVEAHGRAVIVAASCGESAKTRSTPKPRHWPTGVAPIRAARWAETSAIIFTGRRPTASAATGGTAHARQHRRLESRLDASLAESEKPIRGEAIHGLLRLPLRRLRLLPGHFHQFEGF